MSDEIEKLKADIQALEISIQSLVTLLAKKGVITTDEWVDQNHETYKILN